MNSDQLRTIVLTASALLSSVPLLAQGMPITSPASQTQANPANQLPASATGMQDSGTNANEVSQAMKDKMFLRHAAEGGMAEVKLGQLAAQKASSEEVKAFGQKMVDDHTTLNTDMSSVADTMGVRLPKTIAKDDQAEYDKLSSLSGDAFDTEYLTIMVRDHHKDLREFRMEATDASDPSLKAAVDKAQKVIREHTMMVDKLARDKGIPVPARGMNKPTPPPAA